MGQCSIREAGDYVGDPIHTLLFDTKSIAKIGGEAKALRRQELFSLLDHYCLLLGMELGFKEEVKKAMEQLGQDQDQVIFINQVTTPPKHDTTPKATPITDVPLKKGGDEEKKEEEKKKNEKDDKDSKG